jgi:amino-acid N-acetyltransferase
MTRVDRRCSSDYIQAMSHLTIRPAVESDIAAIDSILRANASDPSLFQQPPAQIRLRLGDFVVAQGVPGRVIGCGALRRHDPTLGEILAVAVHPAGQRAGVGSALVCALVDRAARCGLSRLWLGTARPDYFARFGFRRISRWTLPPMVLVGKLRLVLQQPPRRWLPALLGRHRFMAMRLHGSAGSQV